MKRIAEGDPFLNYCHWPYEPPVPGVGKLCAESLLFAAVELMPAATRLRDTLHTIQSGIGAFRSVYGVKRNGERWALEIYIYDYQRQQRVVSVERLEQACRGVISLPSVGNDVPYFMFSFDLEVDCATESHSIDLVHVYIGNPGSTVSSGISYGFRNDNVPELENFYFFFAANDRVNIADKLECSPFPRHADIAGLLDQPFMNCHTVCLANKPTCNTIYWSGIDIDLFVHFLEWQRYPGAFVQFVRSHKSDLDHLLYDVGVDYRATPRGLQFLKSGFYGIL